jgi:hypothetical protein
MQLLHALVACVNHCFLACVNVDTTFLKQLEVMLPSLSECSTYNLFAFTVCYELGFI